MYKDGLKKLRESNNVKQMKMSELLGVNVKAYSMYETEYEIMPIKHLVLICDYFNVSLDYIFGFNNIKQYDNSKKDVVSKVSGERIKEFRKTYKLTQTDLGVLLNCSYGTIAGYESGRYLIATPFLYTICKNYNISADYLLGRIDSKN